MSPKRIQSDPQWVKGVQSGYDPDTAMWRNPSGKATSRAEAVRSLQEELTMLGGTATFQPDKLSAAAEKIEHLIGGGFNPFSYDDVGKTKANVPHIPGNVLASYRLADFFYQTEGDIAAAVETPIQVAMRDLDINCPDPEVKKELETMYDVDGLDMVDLIQSMWLSMAVFGIAHPFEAWEGSELKGIILLPPMYTSVGSHLSGDFLMPMGDEKQWTREALKSLLPAAMYDAMNRPDEMKPVGKLPLPDGVLYSVRGLDQKWRPYPKPWMQGAFRSMNTRIVYEEMRRAVYEGFRHQLWAFLLGDKDVKPTPQMMTKLINDVTGMSGERTGNLCWWGALRIEVHTPKTDNLMSAEEWWMLNLDIFRRLGMSMRVTTGNSYQGERGGSDYTFDVDIMLEKFEFMRKALLRWERGFRLRYAEKTGSEAFKKAARETEVVFALNMMELRKQIQERLVPMFTTGALSVQTLLKRSNESFEVEKANKQALKNSGDDELFAAPATFSQTTVNPDTPEKKSSVTDKGRPADTGKAKKPDVEGSEALSEFQMGVNVAARLMQVFSEIQARHNGHTPDNTETVELLKALMAQDEQLIAALARPRGDNAPMSFTFQIPETKQQIVIQSSDAAPQPINVYVEPTPVTVNNQNRIDVAPTPVTVMNQNQIDVAPTPVSVTNEVSPTPVTNTIVVPVERVETSVIERDEDGRPQRIRKIIEPSLEE